MPPNRDAPGPVDTAQSPCTLLHTLPYASTALTGGFWADRQAVNRSRSLAHGFAMLETAGNLRNLRIAAGQESGEFVGFWFADSDVYKWQEAAAWELGRAPDAELQRMADVTIALVEAAQQPDGYLDSYFQIPPARDPMPIRWARWSDLDHGHELYCAGHLIQAAVAFVRAAGDDRLLRVALRLVDHVGDLFGPGKRDETCGHPEIEMALVELYRLTRDPRHLELAQLFVDRRGRNRMRGHAGYGPVYQQDHVPVREATEVAGHAVRQLYLTAGVTDIYMETGEQALLDAMHTLWADMVDRKLYVTGGIGSRFDGESFGGPYELPADTCYCETCAAIASLMWNWRLLLVTGHARYADLFERTLYNGVLASPGLEGASYLYVNPLHVRGGRYVRASTDSATGAEASRPAWHNCACCPPNVMRLFSSLHHYLATRDATGIQLHQYAPAALDVALPQGRVLLDVETDYPWGGTVNVTVRESPLAAWRLSLRLPEWARSYTPRLNGGDLAVALNESGYLSLERQWRPGDTFALDLHVEPAWVLPHPRIDAVRGCAALQRGPLIYCFESHDQPSGVDLLDVHVELTQPLVETPLEPFGAIALRAAACMPDHPDDALYRQRGDLPTPRPHPVHLTAIPYYAWGNRGMQSMRVWMPVAQA